MLVISLPTSPSKQVIQNEHRGPLLVFSPGSGGASAEAGACANGGNRAKAGGSSTGWALGERKRWGGRLEIWGNFLAMKKGSLVGWVI